MKTRTYEYQYTGPVGQALFGIELRAARILLPRIQVHLRAL